MECAIEMHSLIDYLIGPCEIWRRFKKKQFLILVCWLLRFSYDNVLRWMLEDLAHDRSTSVQVMSWVPLGAKPLPKPGLAKISDTIWRH